MRAGSLAAAFASLSVVLSQPTLWSQGQQRAAAIENVTVIDVQTGNRLTNQTVLVEGNKISNVGTAASVKIPGGARRIDGRGKFLIPGLWQMHGHDLQHYGIDYGESMAPFQLFIANGVTGLRDMGSTIDEAFVGKKRIQELGIAAPRIFAAGPLIEGPQVPNPQMAPLVIGVATPDEGRLVVDALKLAGVDLIKIHGNMSRDSYFAMATEAKRKNIPFAGHIPMGVSIVEASDAGQASIEHLNWFTNECTQPNDRTSIDGAKCEAIFARMKANGTFLGPTLIGEMPLTANHPFVSEDRFKYVKAAKRATFPKFPTEVTPAAQNRYKTSQQLTRMAAEAGIKLIVSTDSSGGVRLPGFSAVDELILFAESGLKTLDVLQAGTLNPALLLKQEKSLGTVTAGKLADLLLIDGDPLADMQNLRRVAAVLADGKVFEAAERQALFDAVVQDARKSN